jgi:hypothetical protein
MVRKAFSGDLVRELPKGKIEPYRLWFEYLKLAFDTIPQRVNKNFYGPWGNIQTRKFDDWFEPNWRELFAVPRSVSVVESEDEALASFERSDIILLRVINSAPLRRQIEAFKKALKAGAQTRKQKKHPLTPQFALDSKRSMNLSALRAMLKFLKISQMHTDLEGATKEYVCWADAWNKNLRKRKNSKRTEILIPAPLRAFAREIEDFEAEQAKSKRRVKKSVQYNNAKSDVRRFQRRAEKVRDNVARGSFPGEY